MRVPTRPDQCSTQQICHTSLLLLRKDKSMVKTLKGTRDSQPTRNDSNDMLSRRSFLGTLGAAALLPRIQIVSSGPTTFLSKSAKNSQLPNDWLLSTEI